jgi:YD repeat-containing protein
VVVKNAGPGVWDSASAWRIIEERRITSQDSADTPLDQVAALEVDRVGRIYVIGGQAQPVRVFDSSGKFLRLIGRMGKGPGEFGWPTGLTWDPHGRLVVHDPREQRISIFDTSGRSIVQYNSTIYAGGPFTADSVGNYLHAWFVVGHDRTGADTYDWRVVRYDSLFRRVDSLLLPRFEGEHYAVKLKYGMYSVPVPFSGHQVWELAPNSSVLLANTSEYRIYILGRKGDTTRIIERSGRPAIPVTGEDVDSAFAGGGMKYFLTQGGKADRSRVPQVMPAFRGMVFDNRRNLWVEPTVSAGSQGKVFDVFDREGRLLGQVRSEVRLSLPEWAGRPIIRGDRIYSVVQDSDGSTSIVIARIVRPNR